MTQAPPTPGPMPPPQPTGPAQPDRPGDGKVGVKVGTLQAAGRALSNSAMTAAMTAGLLYGGQSYFTPPAPPPAPLPTPGPYEPAPAPSNGFGGQVLAAFQQDGGTKPDALIRGAMFQAFGLALVMDGQEPQPSITTMQGLLQAFGRANRLRGLTWDDYPATRGIVEGAISQIGPGAFDEQKRNLVVSACRDAGDALAQWGSE